MMGFIIVRVPSCEGEGIPINGVSRRTAGETIDSSNSSPCEELQKQNTTYPALPQTNLTSPSIRAK